MKHRVSIVTCLVAAHLAWSLAAGSAFAEPARTPRKDFDIYVVSRKPTPAEDDEEPHLPYAEVSEQELRTPGASAADVLRYQLSMQVADLGGLGAPSTASLRGASAAQLPIYFGGVRLNNEGAGAANLSDIPLWLVESAKIYRGHAPARADQLGIAGAIFFEPRRFREDETRLGVSMGSYGRLGADALVARGNSWLRSAAALRFSRAENDYPFTNDRGTLWVTSDDFQDRRQNLDVTSWDSWLSTDITLNPRAELRVLANISGREQGATSLALVPARHARAEFLRSLLALSANLALDAAERHRLTLQTTWLDTHTRLSSARELGYRTPIIEHQETRLGQELRYAGLIRRRMNLHAGLGAHLSKLEGREVQLSRMSQHKTELRPTLSLNTQFTREWATQLLGAVECHSTLAGLCPKPEAVGRLGVSWSYATLSVFADVGRYARFPTLTELYGAGVAVRGNSDLLPETGLNYDFGVRAALRGLTRGWFALSVYRRDVDRLITYGRSSEGYFVPQNLERARLSGLEFSSQLWLWKPLSIQSNLAFLDGHEITSDGSTTDKPLPLRSRFSGSAALIAAHTAQERGLITQMSASARYTYRSNSYANLSRTALIPEQGSLDLEGSLGVLDSHWTTRLRVTNLLDTAQVDVVGFPLPGRSVYVSMESVW